MINRARILGAILLASVAATSCDETSSAAAASDGKVRAATDLQPQIAIERDASGKAYLRVYEPAYDPFAPSAPDRTVKDKNIGPDPGASFVIFGDETVRVANVSATRVKYGVQFKDTPTISIEDFAFNRVDGGEQIHGGALKFGNGGAPTRGVTYITRVVADGGQQPDGSYEQRNTDFIGVESGNAPIYMRNVTGRNFSDAAIDSKSKTVYVMNATLEGGHRSLRVWGDAEIVLVNSIVNSAKGRSQAWLYDGRGRIRYHNVLWCDGADNPSRSHPDCRTAPWLVEGDQISKAQAAALVTETFENPLPEQSPFFATAIDRIEVEYSADNGPWRSLSLPNAGGNGASPIGDLRWAIPLNLDDSVYRFRASVSSGGRRVGRFSAVIGEAG